MGKNKRGKGGKPKGSQEGDGNEPKRVDQNPQVEKDDPAKKPSAGESSGVRVFPKQTKPGDSKLAYSEKNIAGGEQTETAKTSEADFQISSKTSADEGFRAQERRREQADVEQQGFKQQGHNKRNQPRKSEERQPQRDEPQPSGRSFDKNSRNYQSCGGSYDKDQSGKSFDKKPSVDQPQASGKPYQQQGKQFQGRNQSNRDDPPYDKDRSGKSFDKKPSVDQPQASGKPYQQQGRQFQGRNQSSRDDPPRGSTGVWQNRQTPEFDSQPPVKSAWGKPLQNIQSSRGTDKTVGARSSQNIQFIGSDETVKANPLQSVKYSEDADEKDKAGPSQSRQSNKKVNASTQQGQSAQSTGAVVKPGRSETSSPDGGYTLENKIVPPGKAGKPIQLQTNHFQVSLGKVKTIIQYDVDFKPDRPKKFLKVAFGLFRNAYFPRCNPAFDGRKQAYSAKQLFDGESKSATITVQKDETSSMEFEVTITKVKEVNLQKVVNWIENRTNEDPRGVVQALEIILGHSLMMNNIKVGSSYFTQPLPSNVIDLGKGMELYRGIFQSINLGHQLYLNVDVANKAFPKEQHLIDLISELCFRADLKQPLDERNFRALDEYIRNLKIQFYLDNKPNLKREYTVNGLHYPASSTKFTYENQEITVEDYFRRVHSKTLRYPHMPCLWVGPRNKTIYLPCEFCKILPQQVVRSRLDGFQTTKMIRSCCTKAPERKRNIAQCLEKAAHNDDPVASEFDLRVSQDFKRLNGRVLDAPRLKYGNGESRVTNGVWRVQKFLKPVNINSWTIVSLDYYVKNPQMEDLAKQLFIRGEMLGMSLGQPVKPFKTLRWNEIATTLEKAKNLDIVFVIIGDGVYSKIKTTAELQVGCLTQCILAKTINRLSPSTVDNILLKVNMKLNGINHVLASVPPIMKEPVMIMGADVTHPSPNSSEPSVAAVTASHDLSGIKYNTHFGVQEPRLEYIQDLEKMTREHINYFQKETGKRPAKIIFYRDGVAMGQFATVLQTEYQEILKACNKIATNYKPLITFIVVQKRHHTRFFPENEKDADRNGNVPAGTCVDTDIVLPRYQNFYLISHASLQGVARPTKYVVLKDENNFNNDDLQMLTYYLCHMFIRCTRSVSYPAATYYAHLAALRGKAYIDLQKFNVNNIRREQEKLKIKEKFVQELPMFFV